jgi:hypothetical protein
MNESIICYAGTGAGSYENNTENTALQQEQTPGNNAAGSTNSSEGMVYLDIIPRFAL